MNIHRVRRENYSLDVSDDGDYIYLVDQNTNIIILQMSRRYWPLDFQKQIVAELFWNALGIK